MPLNCSYEQGSTLSSIDRNRDAIENIDDTTERIEFSRIVAGYGIGGTEIRDGAELAERG